MFRGLLQPMHLLLILVIVLIVFGGRLSKIGFGLAQSVREFKKALSGDEDLSEHNKKVADLKKIK